MRPTIAVRFNVADQINEMLYMNDILSDESKEIQKKSELLAEHYSLPISRQESEYTIKFQELKLIWEANTAILSSITEIAMHPAYQQIIGMGQSAIPLILEEMNEKPGHWFWALKSITGEDPVLPEQRGRIKKMTEAWINWGRNQGYIL
ncbi:MAG: hypothetical protein GY941_17745 [Planctomycetes bacterium]|nr:hypothetical protein [Planctomycetota bacterium]